MSLRDKYAAAIHVAKSVGMQGSAEEREDRCVRLGRLLAEVVGRHHEQLLTRADGKPALELLGVVSAGRVGVVPPGAAEGTWILDQTLDLSRHAVVLRGERVLEGHRLTPERHLVLVLRVGAVDRIAEKRDELGVRDERPCAFRRERMNLLPLTPRTE